MIAGFVVGDFLGNGCCCYWGVLRRTIGGRGRRGGLGGIQRHILGTFL